MITLRANEMPDPAYLARYLISHQAIVNDDILRMWVSEKDGRHGLKVGT